MTFKEAIIKYLTENGMFPNQAEAVFNQYSTCEHSMNGRWGDVIDGYPDTVLAVLVIGIKAEAVKWIDENLPKVWFRPMFAA